MSVNLDAYPAIYTALFVRIDIPNYTVMRFSDYYKALTINGESYTGLGSLMNVSDSTSELRLSDTEVSVTFSGIPAANIDMVQDYLIKGSDIQIYRGIFNPTTGALLSIAGNPMGKFKGIVNNFALQEQWTEGSDDSTVTVLLTCTSVVSLLRNKISGRRTNPIDQQFWYPADQSMNRVPNLADSNYNFGAPK
jgi:hypothetical protein